MGVEVSGDSTYLMNFLPRFVIMSAMGFLRLTQLRKQKLDLVVLTKNLCHREKSRIGSSLALSKPRHFKGIS